MSHIYIPCYCKKKSYVKFGYDERGFETIENVRNKKCNKYQNPSKNHMYLYKTGKQMLEQM